MITHTHTTPARRHRLCHMCLLLCLLLCKVHLTVSLVVESVAHDERLVKADERTDSKSARRDLEGVQQGVRERFCQGEQRDRCASSHQQGNEGEPPRVAPYREHDAHALALVKVANLHRLLPVPEVVGWSGGEEIVLLLRLESV